METRITVGLFVMLNLLLVVEADFNRENVTNRRLDSNEIEEYQTKLLKNRRRKLGLVGTRPAWKMSEISLQSDVESVSDLETEETDPLEAGYRKILIFGKRVFESIEKNGFMAKDIRLLKSGKYRIDWWKHSRRLEEMRRRLHEELERNPKLKFRLHSLGWRNNSELISHDKKINANHSAMTVVKKSTVLGDVKNTVLYRIMGFNAEEPNTDTPTKLSLSTFHQKDFGAMTSDVGVIDVMSGEMPTSSKESWSTSDDYPSGQVVDSDRLLQLIPLVVDEQRQGLISDEERRAFRCIFGKRLWQLLEREASKPLTGMMDYDLAKFLLKGELPERDPENARQGRHLRQNALGQKKRKHVRTHNRMNKEHDNDYNYETDNYNDYYKGMKDRFQS